MNIFYSDPKEGVMKNNTKTSMMAAIKAVHDHGYTPTGVANELGVASMDLDQWLEDFDELYQETYNKDYQPGTEN